MSKSTLEPSELRSAVLEFFYKRGLRPAWNSAQILLLLAFKGLTLEELEDVLEFLLSLKYVAFEFEPLGSTKYWKMTAGGMLFWERERAK
jgi:hypothetical protein